MNCVKVQPREDPYQNDNSDRNDKTVQSPALKRQPATEE